MVLRRPLAALAAVTTIFVAGSAALTLRTGDSAPRPAAGVLATYDRLPLSFAPAEPGSPARFEARGAGYSVFLTDRGSVLALRNPRTRKTAVLRTTLADADAGSPQAERRLPGLMFAYHGKQRRERIPTFARIRYPQVYPGIDAVYHGTQGKLEYDFEVSPGVDPARIGMRLDGARSLRIDDNGDLLIGIAGGTLRQSRPVAYQRLGDRRVPVGARFALSGKRIGFRLGSYDHAQPVVIDPELSFATYLGGGINDRFNAVARQTDGTVYVAGATSSLAYPGTPVQGPTDTDEDVIVSRLAADGKSLVSSTRFGGSTAASGYTTGFETDEATDIATTFTGAIVVGYTQTTDFPGDTTVGTCSGGGRSGFAAQVTVQGALGWSHCFGGNANDTPESVALRAGAGGGSFLVDIVGTTRSSDAWGAGTAGITPFKASPSGGSRDDAFILELEIGASPDRIRYRSFLNGNGYSSGNGVAVDDTGIYFTGDTNSTDLATTAGSPTFGGIRDAFVGKIALAGTGTTTSLSFLRYYGTNGQENGRAIALGKDAIYVVGDTDSDSLPVPETTGNLLRGQGQDGFIAAFSTSGVLSKSIYVGGEGTDTLEDIAVQSTANGNTEYVVGTTDSGDFTTRNAVPGQSCTTGDTQALVVKRIDADTVTPGAIITCLGGNDADGDFGNGVAVTSDPTDGTIYVAGTTGGNFPGMNGYQTTYGGWTTDGFVLKLGQKKPSIDSAPPAVLGNAPAHFTFSTTEAGMAFTCSAPVAGNFVAGTRSKAACPTVGSADYSDLADGSQTFEVRSVDAFGSESEPTTHTFTVDKTPPAAFEAKSPADGEAVVSSTPTFSWTASSDAHGITSYTVAVDDQAIKTVDSSACIAGTCTTQANAPIVNGKHTWKVVASDGATPANTTATAARALVLGAPPAARFSIAPNPALVNSKVTFDGSGSADAGHVIAKYEWDLDGDGSFETDSGTEPTTTKSFADPQTVNVSLRVTDSSGLTNTASQQLRVSNTSSEGAQVGVTVNGGAQFTNKTDVELAIVFPSSATAMLISNDGGFLNPFRTAPQKTVKWKLDSSGPERLPKTVYVRFLTGPIASPNFTDDIILDERPPVVQQASVSGPPAAATAVAAKKWKVKVKASDSNSGVGSIQVTANKRKPGKLLAYRRQLTVKAPGRPKFLRARDRAGNFSAWKKLR